MVMQTREGTDQTQRVNCSLRVMVFDIVIQDATGLELVMVERVDIPVSTELERQGSRQ